MIHAVAAAALSTPHGRKATAIAAGLILAVPLALVGGVSQNLTTVNACTPATATDSGERPPWWNTADAGPERESNVRVILSTAARLRLPPRAAVIAIATAIQESKLINLPDGHLDSAGLFQQRPSAQWGTYAQVTDPVYASTAFYRALLAVPRWDELALTEAAQAVQRSAYPDAYAQWEPLATALSALGTSNSPSADPTTGPSSPALPPLPPGPDGGACRPVPGIPTNPGSPFHDGPAVTDLPRANPRTAAQAIAWAALQQTSGTTGWYRRCLGFVALTYGWNVSGINYAIDAYTSADPQYRHAGDRNPPPGALLFWDTGQRAGHVALYLGGGMIATTDNPTRDQVGIIPAEAIEQQWGATYLGWTPPYFPSGG